jgi:hypothetical protein
MKKCIINPELHRQLFGEEIGAFEKTIRSTNYNFSQTIYWYLDAGDDYPRIQQVCELAETNNLNPPNVFVLTDKYYLLSESGKVKFGFERQNEERLNYLRENFHHLRSCKVLPGFDFPNEPNWESDTYRQFEFLKHFSISVNELKDDLFGRFFNQESYKEIKIRELTNKGFSEPEIQFIWEYNYTEEGILKDRINPELIETRDELYALGILYPTDEQIQNRELEIYNHVKFILDNNKQIASIYKHNTKELFLVLLAVDNINYANSELGQKTYAIVGGQTLGINQNAEIAAAVNYKVLFQLSGVNAFNPIQNHRDDIQVVETPYEINN